MLDRQWFLTLDTKLAQMSHQGQGWSSTVLSHCMTQRDLAYTPALGV